MHYSHKIFFKAKAVCVNVLSARLIRMHCRHHFHLRTGLKIFKFKEFHPTTTAAVCRIKTQQSAKAWMRGHRLQITTRGSGWCFLGDGSAVIALHEWCVFAVKTPRAGVSILMDRGDRVSSGVKSKGQGVGGRWGGYLWFCKEIVMLTTIRAVTTYNDSKKFGNTLGLNLGLCNYHWRQ